ncbi:hypothetical protein [Microbacterium sp.]|uniref:hypothetical protein n=1 Tax=Microbacterium sp. TaxID=51671 RepID=UPI002810A402|nr:hypothetical protein [Microbacterium sp.]
MTGLLLKYALVGIILVLLVALVWWGWRHPNRGKSQPNRLRMPKLVAIVGWALLAVGFLLGLIAFTSRYTEDLAAMRIASGAMAAGGILFLVMYRNWYVAPEADAVRFRTVFGVEKSIAYSDIAEYRTTTSHGQPRLVVRSTGGDTLALNPALFDVAPLQAAIAFKERTGRWPLRGEAR